MTHRIKVFIDPPAPVDVIPDDPTPPPAPPTPPEDDPDA